jgi:hypothetical protein
MGSRPGRAHWAIALAALVGAVAGSFLAASMDTAGISTEGSLPLLAGGPAIFVASLAGALLGAAGGALTAFWIGRASRKGVAAVAGSAAGIAVGAIVGYLSEILARAWITAFSGNPLEGAVVGGAIAGGYAGVAVAAMLRVFGDPDPHGHSDRRFAALLGSLLGLLAGAGGGSIGATLAQSVLVCPNGYYAYPFVPAGCNAGILQGAILFGIWGGAVAGAFGALVAAYVLPRLSRASSAGSPTA